MTSRSLLTVAASIAAGMIALAQAAPRLVITFPEADGYISGPVILRARLDPPSTPVVHVGFFVDGRLTCQVERAPYECPFNAGTSVLEHQVRVVATLPNGTRLVQTVRTRGVEYTEAVDVDAIQVTVVVTDQDGQFVRQLPKSAFRVYQDDAAQRITYFASGDIPLELSAAIDVSGSMIDGIPALKRSVRTFLAALKPENKVTLLAFNDNIFTLARASVDPAARLRAVDRLAAWGGTSLYDVILRAVDMLGRQLGRRALVVFSDGEDTASHITLKTAEDRLQRSDATVYTIAQGQAYRRADLRQVLERLARTSGGRAFASDDLDMLGTVFADILDELSNQYLLAYVPPDLKHDGAWHTIRVEVTPKTYRVRAREGYRAPGGTTPR